MRELYQFGKKSDLFGQSVIIPLTTVFGFNLGFSLRNEPLKSMMN